jgi:hypothetical protein
MTKFLFAATTALALVGQTASASTSVASRTSGNLAYDATTATITATHTIGNAELSSSLSPLNPTNQSAVATLKINFAAPLRRTDEVQQTEWTGSGHRYIASFVRGTAISFEYLVDSLPDVDGLTANFLIVKSQPGFRVPFVSLDQLSYYYDFNGNNREGADLLYNPFEYYHDMTFVGLLPPCNCVNAYGLGPTITAFTATSDIADYVQNIFPQSNAFRLHTNGSGYDLFDVTTSGMSTVDSFASTSVAEWSPAVPEPASWAMMIAGFGLVGASLRRQRQCSPGSSQRSATPL